MRNRRRLNEAEEEVTIDDSIDAQVYAFFTQAESTALGAAEARTGLGPFTVESSLRNMSLKFLLKEAGEEGGTEGEETESEFHVEAFTSEVSRLIQNADTLLDLKNTIIEMAKKYLTDKYDEDTASQFVESLQSQHNIELADPNQSGMKKDNFAVGARSAGA